MTAKDSLIKMPVNTEAMSEVTISILRFLNELSDVTLHLPMLAETAST
jgi:hypothetical protein